MQVLLKEPDIFTSHFQPKIIKHTKQRLMWKILYKPTLYLKKCFNTILPIFTNT